jgi:hypothetical protein
MHRRVHATPRATAGSQASVVEVRIVNSTPEMLPVPRRAMRQTNASRDPALQYRPLSLSESALVSVLGQV